MARYIDANVLIKDIEQSKANNNHNNSIASQTHNAEHRHFIKMVLDQPTADVVEVEKVAEILADVTGASPCDFIGNEWLVSCCEYVGHCCQKSDGECWMQYLKYFGNEKEQCNENTR